MKVLLVSPLGFAVNPQTKYAGIERLVLSYATELSKRHEVFVLAHADSVFPPSVTVYPHRPTPGGDMLFDAELTAFQTYQSAFRKVDVIHDFSHGHLASRYMGKLPSLNIFWHDPVVQYPKAPYNVIALSQWAKVQFKRYYHQDSKVMQSIAIDPRIYKPLSKSRRGDRYLTIGRMAEEKGNLRALGLCMETHQPLDICGGDSDPKYKEAILRLCDGKQIRFLGEVTDEEKLRLMQTCKALIYATTHAEVTNHKLQESMFCKSPVIVSNIGAAPEIVTHGVNGFLCNTHDDFIEAMDKCGDLLISKGYKDLLERYSIENVVQAYEPLYSEVANGAKW